MQLQEDNNISDAKNTYFIPALFLLYGIFANGIY